MSNSAALSLRTTTSERALVTQMSRAGQNMTLALPSELIKHDDVGEPLNRLNATLTGVADALTRDAPNLSDAGFNSAAIGRIGPVAVLFRLTIEAQRASLVRVEDTLADVMTPRFPETFPIPRRVELRAWTRTLSAADTLEAAIAEPATIGAAIVEGGAPLSGLPIDGFNRLKRAVAVEQLAERILSNNRANMRIAPSVADPIGGAPDYATARRNAADRIDALEAERDLLGRVPGVLSNVVLAVSILTGENREATLERLI
jgi:hypothetical protein